MCLEGLQGGRWARIDSLGDDPGWSRQSRDTSIGHFLASSLFSFLSMTLCSTFHVTYSLLGVLLKILQKYTNKYL